MVSLPSPSLPNSTIVDKPSRWGMTLAAVLLSLILPGAGQLLNRQPARAAVAAGANWLIRFVFYVTKLILVFSGFALSIALWAVAGIAIATDAGRVAWRPGGNGPGARAHPVRFVWAGLAVLLFSLAFDPGWFVRALPYVRAFRVPSDSMCPAICLNERMMADMNAYISKPPKRGDVVMISRPNQSTFLVKRIVGLPGDVISQSGGEILVNGQSAKFPVPCGIPDRRGSVDGEMNFSSSIVPNDQFFVVGDNLPNSFDSRLPEFGPVKAEQIRGRPLFLYWSPGRSRIGCAIR